MRETWVRSLGWEDPLEKEMATHSSGKSHGQRSMVGYSPWGRTELDTTERLHFSEIVSEAGGHRVMEAEKWKERLPERGEHG